MVVRKLCIGDSVDFIDYPKEQKQRVMDAERKTFAHDFVTIKRKAPKEMCEAVNVKNIKELKKQDI